MERECAPCATWREKFNRRSSVIMAPSSTDLLKQRFLDPCPRPHGLSTWKGRPPARCFAFTLRRADMRPKALNFFCFHRSSVSRLGSHLPRLGYPD
jgi:hypothetical protein